MLDETGTETLDPSDLAALPKLHGGTRRLSVVLTEEEWADTSERAAAAFEEIIELESEEKLRRSQYGAAHKVRTAEHARMVHIVHERCEERDVSTVTYGDLGQNQRITVRTDTYEVIGREALSITETERLQQGSMFDGDGDSDGEEIEPEEVDLSEDGADRPL